MGYLNNQTVTVDAILTTKGRELLAKGQEFFKITKFALADDEIDYTLYDVTHPLGSNYFGQVIENMPILEAFPDTDQVMKHKLITLPRGSKYIPLIGVPAASSGITLSSVARTQPILPRTTNIANGNNLLGYTAILGDSTVANLRVTPGAEVANAGSVPSFFGDDGTRRTVTAVGHSFELNYISQLTDRTTSLIIIGNETGGRITINITAKQDIVYNSTDAGYNVVQS
jgi:hypothetical protein